MHTHGQILFRIYFEQERTQPLISMLFNKSEGGMLKEQANVYLLHKEIPDRIPVEEKFGSLLIKYIFSIFINENCILDTFIFQYRDM